MIRFTLAKDGRKAWIDAKDESDADLVSLLKSGWVIRLRDKILQDSILLAFLDANGPTSMEAIYQHFHDIKPMNVDVAVANLYQAGHIVGMRSRMATNGVYVSQKHVEAYKIKLEDEKPVRNAEPVPFLVEEDITEVAPVASEATDKPAEGVEITKAEGKRQRANIINHATNEDLLGGSLRASFWDKMEPEAKVYWGSLDDFKRKLILTEIKKKV